MCKNCMSAITKTQTMELYMRISVDGGQVYVFAAANYNLHYDKMLVEALTEIQEAPDGNGGDTLIYADGTGANRGELCRSRKPMPNT